MFETPSLLINNTRTWNAEVLLGGNGVRMLRWGARGPQAWQLSADGQL